MPLTPYHLGPAAVVCIIWYPVLHIPTFLIACILPDLEPFLILVWNLNFPLHAFFHTLAGGSLEALIFGSVMIQTYPRVMYRMPEMIQNQPWSQKSILLASFIGVYLHILLDAPLYADIMPLYPLSWNPLLDCHLCSGWFMYILCILMGGIAGLILIYRVYVVKPR